MTAGPPRTSTAADGTGAARPRDLRAMDRFELFLFTAIATVLVVRGALAVTGYPQVGGKSDLHVAHVLYGGLLMGVAIVLVEVLPGTRTRLRAAFVGGIGFGLFLDEIGKFLTKSVDYFYRPTVTIIYAVLVVFYLVVRELVTHRALTDPRRLALAATAVSDLTLGQLDTRARERALALLPGAQPTDLAEALQAALRAEPARDHRLERLWSRVRDRADELVGRVVRHRLFTATLGTLLVLELLGSAGELALILVQPDLGRTHGSHTTDVGAIAATAVGVGYVAFGLFRLRRGDDQGALTVLTRAAAIAILFTQLFVFVRYEWSGLLGFALQAVLLAATKLAAQVLHDDPHLDFDARGTLRRS